MLWSQGVKVSGLSIELDRSGGVGVERLSEREKDEIVRLSAMGWPSRLIGQQIGRLHRTVWGYLSKLRRPVAPEPIRSPLRLSLHEREEISPGLAAGESRRSIARRLGRSASTIAREVTRNGDARRYRACPADRAALAQALAYAAESGRTYISEIERGQKSMTVKMLFRLSLQLGESPADLIRRVEQAQTTP